MKFVQVLLIFATIISWSYGERSTEGNHSINLKKRRSIYNSMNTEAEACSNFYEYACGKWIEHQDFDIESNQEGVQSNYEVSLELVQYMADTHMTDKPEFVKKAYEFYTSCTEVEDYGELNYMQWMEEHENMTWALLSSSEDKDAVFDWVHTLALMRKYGMNGLFIKEISSKKASDPSKNIIRINKDAQKFIKIYGPDLDHLNDTVKVPSGKKPIMELQEEFSEFDERLEKVYEVEDKDGEKMITLKGLSLPWLKKYVVIIFEQASLDSEMELAIKDIPYMEALDALLEEYDDEFICRYLEVRFLTYLYEKVRTDSEVVCMEMTRGLLPMAMHWIYEQLHPELEEEIPKINEMFGKIVKHVNETLRSDKSGAIPATFWPKLDNVQLKVGNLPRVDTVNVLESFYANLKLNSSDFYGNHLQLLALYNFNVDHMSTTNELHINVNQFFDKTEDEDSGYDIFPTYLSAEDVLIVPMELLRQPFYHWGYDDIFKYSGLGSIMTRYVYSDLEMTGFSIDDLEKIAEIGSLHSTFHTLFSSADSFPDEAKYPQDIIDMIQVPTKQLFFLNAAHVGCSRYGDHDSHNQIFFHLPEFAETFDCKLNNFLKIFND